MKHVVIVSAAVFISALCSGKALAADPAASPDQAAVTASAKMPAHLEPMVPLAMPPDCLQETGTHITPKDGCVAMANGRSYGRDELTANRELTLGGALSRDPAITIQNHH